jgi:hypothetical protein
MPTRKRINHQSPEDKIVTTLSVLTGMSLLVVVSLSTIYFCMLRNAVSNSMSEIKLVRESVDRGDSRVGERTETIERTSNYNRDMLNGIASRLDTVSTRVRSIDDSVDRLVRRDYSATQPTTRNSR